MKTIKLKIFLADGLPGEIYDVWMNSKGHSRLIGTSAKIEPKVGKKFSMWDGSIHGENIKLSRPKLIVQKWASDTDGWPEGHFSELSIKLHPVMNGTGLQLTQKNVPDEAAKDIEKGWEEYYFQPLKKMFGKNKGSKSS